MTEGPKSHFEGSECPTCGAKLHVAATNPDKLVQMIDGPVVPSRYRCEGTGLHRFEDKILTYKSAKAKSPVGVRIELMPIGGESQN